MTKVFIGGSRHVSRLNAQVRKRIDNIIEKEFPILIGDANGADKAVQQYLHSNHYKNVEVFCSDGICRNNIGDWEIRSISVGTRKRNVQFYSAKDRIMAQEATFGLMLWDGKSIGTLLNVALVPFHVTQSSAPFIMPLFESRRAHGARSHGPESLKPLPGLDVS